MALNPIVLNGVLQLSLVDFRGLFAPKFDAPGTTDAQIEMNWEIAAAYMSQLVSGDISLNSQYILCNQVTAHLLRVAELVALGQNPRIVVSASEDNVSRAILPPPTDGSYYQWFFSLSFYGQSFLALLDQVSSGGVYIGADNSLAAMTGLGG